jgi:hypothetical protein
LLLPGRLRHPTSGRHGWTSAPPRSSPGQTPGAPACGDLPAHHHLADGACINRLNLHHERRCGRLPAHAGAPPGETLTPRSRSPFFPLLLCSRIVYSMYRNVHSTIALLLHLNTSITNFLQINVCGSFWSTIPLCVLLKMKIHAANIPIPIRLVLYITRQ